MGAYKNIIFSSKRTKLTTHTKDNRCPLRFEPNNFQKMRVKYAAQIFRQTVYGALNTFIHAKFLPDEARATAEFVKSINYLFDVLNSKSVKRNNKYQRELTLNKDQIEVLDSA